MATETGGKHELCFLELLNFPSHLKAASAGFVLGVISGLHPGSVLPGFTSQQEGSGLDVSPSL